MGEIADSMVDGEMCSWCGIMFTEEHGYPVACDSCWSDALDQYGTATEVTKNTGVQKHLHDEI